MRRHQPRIRLQAADIAAHPSFVCCGLAEAAALPPGARLFGTSSSSSGGGGGGRPSAQRGRGGGRGRNGTRGAGRGRRNAPAGTGMPIGGNGAAAYVGRFRSADGWNLSETSGAVDAMAMFAAPPSAADANDPWGAAPVTGASSAAPAWGIGSSSTASTTTTTASTHSNTNSKSITSNAAATDVSAGVGSAAALEASFVRLAALEAEAASTNKATQSTKHQSHADGGRSPSHARSSDADWPNGTGDTNHRHQQYNYETARHGQRGGRGGRGNGRGGRYNTEGNGRNPDFRRSNRRGGDAYTDSHHSSSGSGTNVDSGPAVDIWGAPIVTSPATAAADGASSASATRWVESSVTAAASYFSSNSGASPSFSGSSNVRSGLGTHATQLDNGRPSVSDSLSQRLRRGAAASADGVSNNGSRAAPPQAESSPWDIGVAIAKVEAAWGLPSDAAASANGGSGTKKSAQQWTPTTVSEANALRQSLPQQLQARVIGRRRGGNNSARSSGGSPPKPPQLTAADCRVLFASQKAARVGRYLPPPLNAADAASATTMEWLVSHASTAAASVSAAAASAPPLPSSSLASAPAGASFVDPTEVAAVMVREGCTAEAVAVLLEALEETRSADAYLVAKALRDSKNSGAAKASPSQSAKRSPNGGAVVSSYVAINKPFTSTSSSSPSTDEGPSSSSPMGGGGEASPIFSPLRNTSSHVEMHFPMTSAAVATSPAFSGAASAASTSDLPFVDNRSEERSQSIPFSSLAGHDAPAMLHHRRGGAVGGVGGFLSDVSFANGSSSDATISSSSSSLFAPFVSGSASSSLPSSEQQRQQQWAERSHADAMRFSAALVPLFAALGDWRRGLEFAGSDMVSLPPSATEALMDCIVGAQRDAKRWERLAEAVYEQSIAPFLAKQKKAMHLASDVDRQLGLLCGTGVSLDRCRALLYGPASTPIGSTATAAEAVPAYIGAPAATHADPRLAPLHPSTAVAESDRVSSALCVWNAFAKRTGDSNVPMVLALAEGLLLRDGDVQIANDFLTPLVFGALGLPIPLPPMEGVSAEALRRNSDLFEKGAVEAAIGGGKGGDNTNADGIRYAVISGLCKVLLAESALSSATTSSASSSANAGASATPDEAAAVRALAAACESCAEQWGAFVPSIAKQRRNATKKTDSAALRAAPPIPSMDRLIESRGLLDPAAAAALSMSMGVSSSSTTSGVGGGGSLDQQNQSASFAADDVSAVAGAEEPPLPTEAELNRLLDSGAWEEAFDVLPTVVANSSSAAANVSSSSALPSQSVTSANPFEEGYSSSSSEAVPLLTRVRIGVAIHCVAKALSGRTPIPLPALRALLGFATREGLFEVVADGCVPIVVASYDDPMKRSTKKKRGLGPSSSSAAGASLGAAVVQTALRGDLVASREEDPDADPAATVFGYGSSLPILPPSATPLHHQSEASSTKAYASFKRVPVLTEGQRQACFKGLSALAQRLASEGSEGGRFDALLVFLSLGAANDGLTVSHALFAVEEMGRRGSIGSGGGGGPDSADLDDGDAEWDESEAAGSMWDRLSTNPSANLGATATAPRSGLPHTRGSTESNSKKGQQQQRQQHQYHRSTAADAADADARRRALLQCFAVYKSMVCTAVPTPALSAGAPDEAFATIAAPQHNDSHVARKILRTLSAHTRMGAVPLAKPPQHQGASPPSSAFTVGAPSPAAVPTAVDVLAAAFPPPAEEAAVGDLASPSAVSDGEIVLRSDLATALFYGTKRFGGASADATKGGPRHNPRLHSSMEARSLREAVHAAARALRMMAWDEEASWRLGLRVCRELRLVGAEAQAASVLSLKLPFMPQEARAEAEEILYGPLPSAGSTR